MSRKHPRNRQEKLNGQVKRLEVDAWLTVDWMREDALKEGLITGSPDDAFIGKDGRYLCRRTGQTWQEYQGIGYLASDRNRLERAKVMEGEYKQFLFELDSLHPRLSDKEFQALKILVKEGAHLIPRNSPLRKRLYMEEHKRELDEIHLNGLKIRFRLKKFKQENGLND